MTTERRPDLDPAAIAEATVIKNAFRRTGIHVKTEPEPDGGIAFMYQKGVLLVRDEDLNRVLAIVAPPETEILDPVYPEGPVPPGTPCAGGGEKRDPGNPGGSRPAKPANRRPGGHSCGASPAGWSRSRCSAAASATTTATMTQGRRTNKAHPVCSWPWKRSTGSSARMWPPLIT